jgi:uncharacterized protein YkwD
MKNILLTIILIFSLNSFSQEVRDIDSIKIYLHEMINEFRVSEGTNSLIYDTLIEEVAVTHNKYLRYEYDVNNKQISHYQENKENPYFTGYSVTDRCTYENGSKLYCAEVIRKGSFFPGQSSKEQAKDIFEGWKNSKEHRKILLDDQFDKNSINVNVTEKIGRFPDLYFVTMVFPKKELNVTN